VGVLHFGVGMVDSAAKHLAVSGAGAGAQASMPYPVAARQGFAHLQASCCTAEHGSAVDAVQEAETQ
jgi:hypothetical protein